MKWLFSAIIFVACIVHFLLFISFPAMRKSQTLHITMITIAIVFLLYSGYRANKIKRQDE